MVLEWHHPMLLGEQRNYLEWIIGQINQIIAVTSTVIVAARITTTIRHQMVAIRSSQILDA